MSQISTFVKKTPIWMRAFGFPRWRHIKVTSYGGIAGNFEDKEVTYSDLPTKPEAPKVMNTKDSDRQSVFRATRSTRSLEEWLVMEFDKAPV